MAYHAIEADRREEGVYTQPWLLGKTYSFKTSSKNYPSSESFIYLKSLDNNVYDFLREDARFWLVTNRLQQAIEKSNC